MADPREPLGRLVHEQRLAVNAGRERPFIIADWELRSPEQQELDMRIGAAVVAPAVAKLDEIRQTIQTFFTHHGNSNAASLTKARDLAEGIRQILDRQDAR